MYVYRAVAKRIDTAMDADAVLEPNVRNALMIAGLAVSRRTAAGERQCG